MSKRPPFWRRSLTAREPVRRRGLKLEALEARAMLTTLGIPTGVVAHPGESVTLPVSLEDGEGVVSVLMDMRFDDQILAVLPENVVLGSALSGDPDATLVVDVGADGSFQAIINTSNPMGPGAADLLEVTYQVLPGVPSGTTVLDLLDATSFINGGEIEGLASDGSIHIPGPEVSRVMVGSSEWYDTFKTALGDEGYELPGTLDPLPWTNIDQVIVDFNSQVVPHMEDFEVRGANVPQYHILAFRHEFDSNRVTLEIDGPIGNDKIRLIVHDTVVDSFGSGLEGGEYTQRFDVLPADVDQSGTRHIDDLVATIGRVFIDADEPGFSIFHDTNGSGVIDVTDIVAVGSNLFMGPLPDGEPGNGHGVVAAAVAATASTVDAGANLDTDDASGDGTSQEDTSAAMARRSLLGLDVDSSDAAGGLPDDIGSDATDDDDATQDAALLDLLDGGFAP